MQLLKGLEPYIEHATEVVDTLKKEQVVRMAGLEESIASYRQMKSHAKSLPVATPAAQESRGPLQISGMFISKVASLY